MLVLSRKNGETIHIGDTIMVEIRRISGNRVTLAIKAPREVRILRGELEDAAKQFDTPPADDSTDESRRPLLEMSKQPRGTPDLIGVPIETNSPHDSGTYFAMS